MPLIDPVTQQVYMLMSGDVYERVKALFEDQSFDLSETCTAQSLAAGAGGWDDPEMDVYDSYDAPKPRP